MICCVGAELAKYVLVSDSSLEANYRNVPLLEFLPSAPANSVPGSFYYFLKGPTHPPLPNGEASVAPYSVRKIEAALLTRNRREDVVVAHPKYLQSFIKDDTEVIAVSTMDPLGLGPLTMSYYMLMGDKGGAWVKREWLALIAQLNALRKGKKAKLLVGGPGVWEFTIMPEEVERESIDYAFQGEADDVVCDLFEQIATGSIDHTKFYEGYATVDDNFHRTYVDHPRFLSRDRSIGTSAPLTAIPQIVRPSIKSMVEIMRGCGIGCDFCEVTLRPLRYYPIENILKEVQVNVQQGHFSNAWLQTDEIFGFRHTRPTFEPNEEALIELFTKVMSVPGVRMTNPTHGRISPATAYPELIKKLSDIVHAGPNNWIGVQVGVETGSDRLAKTHMPNKTLPLHVGPDGSWARIVLEGTMNMTKYWWRPAITVQTGQRDETDEDNWDTVSLINKMSGSYSDGRPLEFTVTPMQNVPLGLIKSGGFSLNMLTEAQLAVYYASYRHLYKMALRNARSTGTGNVFVRLGIAGILPFGGWALMKFIEHLVKKKGLDVEKVKRYGMDGIPRRPEAKEILAKV